MTAAKRPEIIRCTMCGHRVTTAFDHIAIDCGSDMTDAEIAALLRESEASVAESR